MKRILSHLLLRSPRITHPHPGVAMPDHSSALPDPSPCPTQGPGQEKPWPEAIARLRAEHRTVEGLLEILDLLAGEAERGVLRTDDLRTTLHLCRELADRAHHAKEEDLLFPLLAQAQPPGKERGPVPVMLHEHTLARALLKELEEAINGGEPGLAAWAARRYVRLLRDHIGAEDAVVFPMAVELLDPAVWKRMADQFALVDQAGFGPELGRLQKIAAELHHRLVGVVPAGA